MKRTYTTIKEFIGSKNSSETLFAKRLVVNDLKIFDQKYIAENFTNFSTELDLKLHLKYSIHSLVLNTFYRLVTYP